MRQSFPGVYRCGNAALPTGRADLDPGALIVAETNVSPVFFEVNSRSGRNTLSDLG
jgi:hypothetical protein